MDNIFNNSSNGEFGFLDILAMISFLAQINNMDKDDMQNEYIHKVIKAIANEIEKLHKENDIIIEQNEKILKEIRKLGKINDI